jgi:hypothetical protein
LNGGTRDHASRGVEASLDPPIRWDGAVSLKTKRDPGAFERAHYIRALHSWTRDRACELSSAFDCSATIQFIVMIQQAFEAVRQAQYLRETQYAVRD